MKSPSKSDQFVETVAKLWKEIIKMKDKGKQSLRKAPFRGEFVIASLRLHKTLMNADNTAKLMVMAIYRI